MARLIALPKKPGATQWSDHRGITLLAVAGKVLTRLILQRLSGVPLRLLHRWYQNWGFVTKFSTQMSGGVRKSNFDIRPHILVP